MSWFLLHFDPKELQITPEKFLKYFREIDNTVWENSSFFPGYPFPFPNSLLCGTSNNISDNVKSSKLMRNIFQGRKFFVVLVVIDKHQK